jgi:hypothetical protein
VRRTASYVFREHPEVIRKFSSAYERRQRATRRRNAKEAEYRRTAITAEPKLNLGRLGKDAAARSTAIVSPIYYQYRCTAANPTNRNTATFTASAIGDLDGDGIIRSYIQTNHSG